MMTLGRLDCQGGQSQRFEEGGGAERSSVGRTIFEPFERKQAISPTEMSEEKNAIA